MKERIQSIMEFYGMTQQEFALKLGLSAATISSLFTGRTNPTNKHVMAIHEAFPQVDVSWLMFGEGDMLGTDAATTEGEMALSLDGSVPTEGIAVPTTDLFSSQIIDAPAISMGGEMAGLPRTHSRTANGAHRGREHANLMQAQLMASAAAIDKPLRKIKEIRVFFDDGTFEAFAPSTKF